MQLSAFFPFYQNHNVTHAKSPIDRPAEDTELNQKADSDLAIPQGAYHWATTAAATCTVMKVRYALLPLHVHALLPRPRRRRNGDTSASLGVPG